MIEITGEALAQAKKIFAESMENSAPAVPGTLIESKANHAKAMDEYLNELALFYFSWGYTLGKQEATK